MKVSELAAELEVPASTVLDQCQRFGIEATWAGAELSGSDVIVLRAELAMDDPIDLTGADAPVGPHDVDPAPEPDLGEPAGAEAGATSEPEAVPAAAAPPTPEAVTAASVAATAGAGAGAGLPPTAVGSMPELLDDLTPEPEPEPAPAGRAPGFAMAGEEATAPDPNATRRVPPREPPAKRRMERSVTRSLIALAVGIACFVGSNFTEAAPLVALLWIICAIALAVAVLDGFRGRRRVQMHPERVRGLWLGTICVILAIGGLVGLTGAVLTAIGDDPASDAPAGIGDLQSVQVARWGYQRADRLMDNGWKQPAREVGSCWAIDASRERDEQRVELADMTDITSCKAQHTMQVMKVFAVNRDADAPYPGTAELLVIAQDECKEISDRLTKKGVTFSMKAEYPTEVGWGAGDHDVACVAVTPPRNRSLGT